MTSSLFARLLFSSLFNINC